MCSLKPEYESYLIAAYITNRTGYYLDVYEEAGVDYPGALEDYCNVIGVPAVTCEVLTNHKNVEYGSPEVSYNEMLAFLSYFGIDVKEMYTIPMPSSLGVYDLTISYLGAYNYNPSSKTLKMQLRLKIILLQNLFKIIALST